MTDQLLVSQIPKPVKSHHHFTQAVSLKGIRADMGKVNGLNAKLAVFLTNLVGSMWCAYVFSILSLLSLPAVLSGFSMFSGVFPAWLVKASLIALVAWIAQTFLQLVLLSVIMVGQNVQSLASDARSEHTSEDTVKIIDALDIHTAGGIKDLHDSLVQYIDDKFKTLSKT
jgi:hypothetical protein